MTAAGLKSGDHRLSYTEAMTLLNPGSTHAELTWQQVEAGATKSQG